MVQACSNDEKNWPSKISLDCPFKDKKQCSKITHNTQLSIDYIVFINGYTVLSTTQLERSRVENWLQFRLELLYY